MKTLMISLLLAGTTAICHGAEPLMPDIEEITRTTIASDATAWAESQTTDIEVIPDEKLRAGRSLYQNIYAQPYSFTKDVFPNYGRMYANGGVLCGAFVSALLVLECLPEDATSWNRAEIRNVPPFKRWFRNIFKKGPEWDHDNPIFNFVLHPYAGAAYFMAARSCGFGFWRSMLFCSVISTVGWEFGVEAFTERPSYQDLVITPVVGSCIGELFYRLKRNIVWHDYTLGGSRILGNVVVFLIDPVNEVLNLMRGSDTRRMHLGAKPKPIESAMIPVGPYGHPGFTLSMTF